MGKILKITQIAFIQQNRCLLCRAQNVMLRIDVKITVLLPLEVMKELEFLSVWKKV